MIFALLFWEYFKIGLFAIGGGMVALPFLYDLSNRLGWFTHAELTNMIAISESTPGPLGINLATYVGYHVGGVAGGIVATVAIVMPCLFITTLVAAALTQFSENRMVRFGFCGIRPAVAALVCVAFWSIFSLSVLTPTGDNGGLRPDPAALCLFAVTLLLLLRFKKHPIWYLAGGALVGMLFAP